MDDYKISLLPESVIQQIMKHNISSYILIYSNKWPQFYRLQLSELLLWLIFARESILKHLQTLINSDYGRLLSLYYRIAYDKNIAYFSLSHPMNQAELKYHMANKSSNQNFLVDSENQASLLKCKRLN